MPEINPSEFLELLASHEEAIMNLYTAYSGIYYDYAVLWQELAAEEKTHAAIIRKAAADLAAGKAVTGIPALRPELVRTSISQLAREAESAVKKQPPLINALVTAMDIEKGMIERKLFAGFSGTSDELKQALATLAEDTKRHIDRLTVAFNENRMNK